MEIVGDFYQIDRGRMVWKLLSADYADFRRFVQALTVNALDGKASEISRFPGRCQVGVANAGKPTRAQLQERGLSR